MYSLLILVESDSCPTTISFFLLKQRIVFGVNQDLAFSPQGYHVVHLEVYWRANIATTSPESQDGGFSLVKKKETILVCQEIIPPRFEFFSKLKNFGRSDLGFPKAILSD